MNLDRFTVKSQEALERAQRIARENGNPDLGNFHLLAALLTEDESPVAAVLEKLGARREAIANEVAEALGGNTSQPTDVARNLGVVWQSRDVDVVAFGIERIGELGELPRRIGEAVEKHDGFRGAMAVR